MWSGTVAFGLVSLPVSLYPATRSTRASLRLVDADGTPLERRYFSPQSGKVLESDDLVRGYPVGEERFVTVEDEELEALAPEKSQEIDLSRFVSADEIEPTYFQRSYFLAPDRGGLKAYRLLARTMEEAGRAGIATFVMRDTEYLVAILAEDGILRAQILRFHDELRSPNDVGLSEPESDARAVDELRAAIAERASDELDRSLLRDSASRRLLELVESKREAGEDVVEMETDTDRDEDQAEEIDLMQVLKRSLGRDQDEEDATAAGADDAEATSADLQRRTKEELYQRARELDVDGRSRMTKQELVDAIRAAS